MKKVFFVGLVIVLGGCVQQGDKNQITEPEADSRVEIVGGDTDTHGCLVGAGYQFDEEVNACVRSWEIKDPALKQVAIVARRNIDEKQLTLTQITSGLCDDCYTVEFTNENHDTFSVPVKNGKVVEATTDNADLAAIILSLLENKNSWKKGEMKVTVAEVAGNYARGGVGGVEPGPGGGMWFAAKVNGNWKIVYDGNGIIFCEALADYPDFPTSMIPQCFDETTQAVVKR